MFRNILTTLTLLCGLSLVLPTPSASAAISARFPNCAAIDADLKRLDSQCSTFQSQLVDLDQAAWRFEEGIKVGIKTTSLIRDFDRRLKRLSDRLTPYQSLPHVRTVARHLKKNIDRVQKQVASVRKKADAFERDVLKPAKQRVKNLRQTIAIGRAKLDSCKREIDAYRQALVSATELAKYHPHLTSSLDDVASRSRWTIRTTADGIAQVSAETQKIASSFQIIDGVFAAFSIVHDSVRRSGDTIKGAEELVGKIDSVITKQINIKNPITRQTKRFNVREVLEKPQDIAGIILKPLNKIVDALLDPILSKMKLEIPTPKGLSTLSMTLDQATQIHRDLKNQMQVVESMLSAKLQNAIATFTTQAQNVRTIAEQRIVVPPRQDPPRRAEEKPTQSIADPSPASTRDMPAMFIGFGS
ncbi:hypothetical protein [Novipirellula artificiosorum]|uniref:Chromosome partition protein Smc n=1 Tax=Novipirellula artificiosorum TaxID=2528016 RepID=A0A5C6E5A5_9BACT|nr:hypothetical protein [Novipirellula artificiosorum]TWU42339.1 hypothetical protein Poly41_06360 [Novipirellula artificiosorum]